jgi:hypothetical protein
VRDTVVAAAAAVFVRQVQLDALPPSASYHRGASTDDGEADEVEAPLKKSTAASAH